MAKTTEKKSNKVQIVLNCVYSGFEGSPGPGATIEVSADEAERLVSIGAASKAD